MKKHITIGTRASTLAMVQTQQVIDRLQQQWPTLQITIEQIRTKGDRATDMPLATIGGDGVFVTEIERALHEKTIDIAVHSLKDLPTALANALRLVIPGPREDVRDVCVTHSTGVSLAEYRSSSPAAALRIGTGSLRRVAQLRAFYANISLLPIRGNVDTRLRKLDAHEYDAIVLAAAGLHRLALDEGLTDRMSYFSVEELMPAPGQGALALEIRNEPEMEEFLAALNDPIVQATTSAERMFMRRLGAGCYLPVAAYGEIQAGVLSLLGRVISLDGLRHIDVRQSIPWTTGTALTQAEQLGIALADQALEQGADDIISALNGSREHQHV